MAIAVQVIRPPQIEGGILGWLKKNLFSPWYNALLTVITGWVLWSAGAQFFQWALNAKWKVVTDNLRLFMVGSYPPDQVWRVWTVVLMMGALLGLSAGIWGGAIRRIAYGFAAAYGLLALTQFGFDSQRWLLANALTIVAGIVIARGRAGLRRFVLIGWLLSFFLTLVILYGFEKNEVLPLVGTDKWGGLLLTFLLALVSIVVSFPLGVLLALGRRSKLPAVSIFSTVYIEVVRGVPLVTILFMAQIMVPLFFPEEMRLDRILRAMAGMTIFAAAYMAENVRGGLQSIPEGQLEAAKAIGLNNVLTTWFIVLPQALRVVIPPIVNLFIGLFKDTTLVTIVGLLDVLAVGKSVLAQPEFLGLQQEVYLFIAAVFYVFCYVMSYASYKLEHALGVGTR